MTLNLGMASMHLTRAAQLTVSAGSIALASLVAFHMPTARATAPASASPTVDRARGAPTAAATLDPSARAAALHARAMSLQMAGRGREAAALHRASAALRPADDSSAATCLELAGNLLTDAGDFAEARVAMKAAAAHALNRGDVSRAAELTLLEGFVAREQGDAAGVATYAREARWLANAPSLSVVQRAAILSRIRGDAR
jgi:hypothetical protein